MAFLDAAKSLKAAAMTGTTVHNLTVTRLDVGHDHGPVSCGWEAPPGRRGRHMAGGASSCSAARHREAEPLCTDRKVVERQCQTSSCRARSAGCGQAGLCASGSGGEWERCLVGRCGSAEQHGEHRQDGAEARKPWQPSLAARVLLILQRRRWMDAAAQARGPSHGRALQLQSSPMRFL